MNKKQERYVAEMIKHGDAHKAYSIAFKTKSKDAIYKGCLRLSKNVHVQDILKQQADKIAAIATQEAVTELKDELLTTILTAAQKREMLFKIVNGQLEVEKIIVAKDGTFKKIKAKPDHIDIIKAIDLDNKMAGDYAPKKVEDVTDYKVIRPSRK